MKRRLTIARSLINDPELLLLDEPTTGLDPQARHVVWDRLFRLKQRGVTLVLTTHYMDEAEQLCDRLVVMDGGRIAAEGSPAALIREWSTREVVELRFAADENEGQGEKVEALVAQPERPLHALVDRVEVLPDRVLLYSRRRRRHGRRAAPRRHPAAVRARAPQQPRGRVPAAHRPEPGRLTDDADADPAARRCRPAPSAPALIGRARSTSGGSQYRRTWRGTCGSAPSSTPLGFLAAMGLGLGSIVDERRAGGRPLGGVDYLEFLAPGLLAALGDAEAAFESTLPGARRDQVGQAVPRACSPRRCASATSSPGTCCSSRSGWRSAPPCSSSSWACSARSHSRWALLCLPAAVLTGHGLRAGHLRASRRPVETDSGFALLFRFGIMPMFLFSGTFFPVSQLPDWLEPVA